MTGLGLTFMADTLRMISPSLVVQINCWASEGRNFPRLNNTFVHNTPSWWQNQVGYLLKILGASISARKNCKVFVSPLPESAHSSIFFLPVSRV